LRDSPTRGIDFATSLAPDSEWAPAAAELARVAELAPEQAGAGIVRADFAPALLA